MNRLIGLFFLLAGALPLSASDSDDVAKELKALEGKWKAVAAAGKPSAKERIPDFVFIVTPGGKATGRMPRSEYQGAITLDLKRKE